jgi:hypothetical protein
MSVARDHKLTIPVHVDQHVKTSPWSTTKLADPWRKFCPLAMPSHKYVEPARLLPARHHNGHSHEDRYMNTRDSGQFSIYNPTQDDLTWREIPCTAYNEHDQMKIEVRQVLEPDMWSMASNSLTCEARQVTKPDMCSMASNRAWHVNHGKY